MAESPTTLTLRSLRKEGYLAAVTEKWNQHAKIRQDLFGFVDVLAVTRNETLAVQCTSWSNISSRVKKITEHENIGAVREANWRIQVWGWKKEKNRWVKKVVDIS